MDKHNARSTAVAITRLRRGDIGGLEALVQQYQVKAVRSAFLITHDRQLAEDVVQNVFLRVFERIDQYDPSRAFDPWFFRIVINDAVKAAVKSSRHVGFEGETSGADGILAEMLVDPGLDPANLAEAADLRELVRTALQHLPPEQRAVIVMRYYLEFSEREMAAELDAPQGTIKWWLYAARRRLRDLLGPTAGSMSGMQEE